MGRASSRAGSSVASPHQSDYHLLDRISLTGAVNPDPNFGWARGKADVLYAADAFAVMGKVNELLAAKK